MTRPSHFLPHVCVLFWGLLALSGCSVLLDFEECATAADCAGSGAQQCSEGICMAQVRSACARRSECGMDESTYCIKGTCKQIDLVQCPLKRGAFVTHPDEVIIPIAALLPLSGSNAEKGINTAQGAELAITQVNAVGGARGAHFGLLVCDTAYEPDRAVSAGLYVTEQLGVNALLGGISSAESIKVVDQVSEPQNVLTISPASTSPGLSSRSDYFWRTIPSDAEQGPVMAELVAERGYKEVVVLYGGAGDVYSNGLFQTLTFHWQATDTQPTKVIYGTYDFEDPAASVDELNMNVLYGKGNAPDAIVLLGTSTASRLIGELESRVIGPQAKKPDWILSEAMRDQTLFQNPDIAPALGRISGTISLRAQTPVFSNFSSLFQTAFGVDPTTFQYADKAYDATFLLALAIEAQENPLAATGGQLKDTMGLVGAGAAFKALGMDFSSAAATLRGGEPISLAGASGPLVFSQKQDLAAFNIATWTVDTTGSPMFVTESP